MTTIRQAAADAVETLQSAGVPDPERDAALLLSYLTGLSPMEVRLNGGQPLGNQQEQRLSSLLLSRFQREPLQYLLGEQWFYGLRFFVDSRVLIPRQETEALCEVGICFLRRAGAASDGHGAASCTARNSRGEAAAVARKAPPCALDLCTGSGAIAVTLKHECPEVTVTAVDLSGDALAVARRNAQSHQADIRFLQGDLFMPVMGERFDLILSNPPYIETDALGGLQPEVTREPPMALDGGEDGLTFYRRIADEAAEHLTPGGLLACEVGDGQAARVAALFSGQPFFEGAEVRPDLYGKPRVVCAYHRKEQP